MAAEGVAGGSELGSRGRIFAGIVGALVALAVFGAAVYVAWPRGGPPAGAPMYVTGTVYLDTGAPAAGASVTVRSEDASVQVSGATGPDGRFNLGLDPGLPTRVVAAATYRGGTGPSATGFRWSPLLVSGGAVDVGRILLPDPANKRLALGGGTARTSDGSVVVTDVPSNVASVWARAYDPDAVPDLFPGDLAEGRDRPLNSFGFLWISALDAAGSPVYDANPKATVRMQVPATQWVDIEDLEAGNGVIDIPIYSFDYGSAYWVREASGRVTDAGGVPVGESQESAIRHGTYAGEVFAEFAAGHFSWWNLDKPPKTCSKDFGDAPDPTYPSLLASDGARHLDICRAWLGRWADAESDANVPNADLYDDGLVARAPIRVAVSNWNWTGSLYLNALADKNDDGDWADAGEWIVQNQPVSVPAGKGGYVEADAVWDGRSWMRLTLTGATIAGYDGRGEFAIGETEDYPYSLQRLSVYVPGNGTVTSDPIGIDCHRGSGNCSAEYRAGTAVTLTATPDPGESFIGWGADCDGTNATCTLTMDADHHVVASFTAPYWILTVYVYGRDPSGNQTFAGNGNVTSDPPGIDCRGDGQSGMGNCTVQFQPGTNVTLTATPDPDSSFAGWGGDCTGTVPTCALTMDMDKWVFAYFMKP